MQYKYITRALLFISILTFFGSKFWWLFQCGGHRCSQEFIDGILSPLYFGSLSIIFTFLTLQFFSEKVNKWWLLFVASWTIPFWIFETVSTPSTQAAGFMTIHRSDPAWFIGVALFILTTFYVLGMQIREYMQTKDARSLGQIIWLVPMYGAFYFAYFWLY